MVQLRIYSSEENFHQAEIARYNLEYKRWEFQNHVQELSRFIDANFLFRQDTYVTRAVIEVMYNKYRTENNLYPERALGVHDFGMYMKTISEERGLLYKRMNKGQVYVGLCLRSEEPPIKLTEQQKRDKRNIKRKELYHKSREYSVSKQSIYRWTRRFLLNYEVDSQNISPFTLEDYQILVNNNLIVWRYKLPESELPWIMGESVKLSADRGEARETLDVYVNFPDTIQCTHEAYEYWKEKNGHSRRPPPLASVLTGL